jgi:hypothetical protein
MVLKNHYFHFIHKKPPGGPLIFVKNTDRSLISVMLLVTGVDNLQANMAND